MLIMFELPTSNMMKLDVLKYVFEFVNQIKLKKNGPTYLDELEPNWAVIRLRAVMENVIYHSDGYVRELTK